MSDLLSDDDIFDDITSLAQDVERTTTTFVVREAEDTDVLDVEGRYSFDMFVEKSEKLVESLKSLSSALFKDIVNLYAPLVEKHLDELVHTTISASQEYLRTMFDWRNGELDSLTDQGVDDKDAFRVFFVGWNNIFPAYPVSTHGDDDRITEIFNEHRGTVIREFVEWFSEKALDYADGYTLYLVEPFAMKYLKGQQVHYEPLKSALYSAVSRGVLDVMKV